MKYNITKMLLLTTLLVLLIGVASASEVSNDTDNTIDNTNTVVQKTQPVTKTLESNVVEEIDTKEIVKEKKNIKTATKTYDVTKTNQLNSTLHKATGDTKYDEVIVNIQKNTYSLSDNYKLGWGWGNAEGGPRTLIINGNGATFNYNSVYGNRFFMIRSGYSLILNDLTLCNMKNMAYDGINNEGNLIIQNSRITGNIFVNGSVIASGGTLKIINSSFNNNYYTTESIWGSPKNYGNIIKSTGVLEVINSTFTYNKVRSQGGAIYSNNANIINSIFENNQVTEGNGGAISVGIGEVNITHSTFNSNYAAVNGGALSAGGTAKINIKNSTFNNNNCGQDGGVISTSSNLTITNSKLNNNKASRNGGAVYVNNINLTIQNTTFLNNTANNGGAIRSYDSHIQIINNTFTHNNASDNCGAIATSNDDFKINDTIFYKNNPINFIINEETNKIELLNTDDYITINDFCIKVNDKTIYHANGIDKLTDYSIPTGNNLVKLILNGTNTTNNVYILRKSKEIEVHNYTELIDAIEEAKNEEYENIKINLLSGNYTATDNITWNNSATKNITINGNGLTLDGQNTYQFINIASEHNLTLENITIRKYTAENGGAIENNGTLNIRYSIFKNNNATENGGAVFNRGKFRIINSTLNNNIAEKDGGAIYSEYEGFIENNYFENNSATNGAAIYHDGYNLSIYNNTFEKNIAKNNTSPVIINTSYVYLENNINENIKPYNNTIYVTGLADIENNVFGKINTTLTINVSNSTPTVGSTIKITLTLIDENNEKLSNREINLTINKTTYRLNTDNDGKVTQNYMVTYLGAKNITAEYSGDNLYNASSNTAKITPTGKYNTTLTLKLSNIAPIKNNNITITATLTDQNKEKMANQNVTIITDTKNYTLKTNANGTVTQSYPVTKLGLNTITVKYNGDSTHHNSTKTNTMTARSNSSQKINTKLTLKSSNNNPSLTDTITFTVTLTDINNTRLPDQNVTLTLNNQNYTLKTDNNGQATQTYQPTKASTQTITAKYNGSNLYYANTTSIKITSGYIYVTSDGKGNGRTTTSPTNITNALAMVKNNEIINLITNTTSDIYNYSIVITNDDEAMSVNPSTTTFTILGQTNKNIIINNNYITNNLDIKIKNIVFNGSSLIGSKFTVENCTFNNNSSIITDGSSTIKNNLFINNNDNNSISITGNNVKVINNIFENNSANKGGAIYVESDYVNITGNTFKNNHAIDGGVGGAIYDCGRYTLIKNNTFVDNTAEKGSAISVLTNITPKTVTKVIPGYKYISTIVKEYIYMYGQNMGYRYPVYTKSDSTKNFTGIFSIDSSYIEIRENTFTLNDAEEEGAIYILADNVIVKENNFTSNHAYEGSSIYLDSKNVDIMHITSTKSVGDYSVFYYAENFATSYLNEIKNGTYAPNTIYSNGLVATNYTGERTTYDSYITTILLGNNNTIEGNLFRQNTANADGLAIVNTRADTRVIENINDTTSKYSSTIYNKAAKSEIIRNIFNDSKINTKITITPNNRNPTINETINLTFTLKDETNNPLTNQKITATINNKDYTLTTNDNGIATRSYTPTTSGVQTITANYKGNNIYNIKTTTTNITVKKINTTLTLKTSNTMPTLNTNITITATLTDVNNKKLSNQNITLNINNKNYTVKTNANGIASQIYKVTNTTSITAKYNGNNIYDISSSSIKVTAKKINTKLTLSVSNSTPTLNTNITITATLTDVNNKKLSNQNITLNINNKNYTVKTNSNGVTTHTYTPTTLGTQTITATYKGSTTYNPSNTTTKITVEKGTANIQITTPKTIQTGLNATFKVTVTDSSTKQKLNGTAIIKVNGLTLKDKNNKNIQLKVVNGQATLSYSLRGYSARNHNVNVVFANSNYARAENSTKMTVTKANYEAFTYTFNACSEKTITINKTLKDSNGNILAGNNRIAIKVGDKTVLSTNTIDGKLNAKFTIPYLPQGKINVTITLGENYRYKMKRFTTTANIYKQNVTVTINNIKAKVGSKITLKAILKNSETKTNVISGKYIFKVNGKQVPLIQNNKEVKTTKIVSKGIAQWDYQLPKDLKAGTYQILLSYNGNTQSNPIRTTSKALTITA